jgi:hypothetical protein
MPGSDSVAAGGTAARCTVLWHGRACGCDIHLHDHATTLYTCAAPFDRITAVLRKARCKVPAALHLQVFASYCCAVEVWK